MPARKPPKFSWVVPDLLAAHGRPAQHGHVQYLCDAGVDILVTLTENKPRALREYPGELQQGEDNVVFCVWVDILVFNFVWSNAVYNGHVDRNCEL